ncbi:MAG: hypothetical protein AAFN74_04210 [Myxococcota bacterium]
MANESAELIIQFRRGVDEASAKSAVSALGGAVRRRMRTDHPDQVMLLAKFPADQIRRHAQEAANHPNVERVEVNSDGFEIR